MKTNHIIKFIDTTLDHAFQIVLSVCLFILGVRGFITGFDHPVPFSNGYPTPFLVFYFSLAIIGGACSFFGVYLAYKSFWWSGLERLGLYVSAPAWGSYAIVTFVSPLSAPSILEFFLFFSISIACLLHADSINKRSIEDMAIFRESVAIQVEGIE